MRLSDDINTVVIVVYINKNIVRTIIIHCFQSIMILCQQRSNLNEPIRACAHARRYSASVVQGGPHVQESITTLLPTCLSIVFYSSD